MKVRFAVSAGAASDPAALAELVDGAEAVGFDSLWFSDLPMLAGVDPLLAVAFAASRSRRLKLGVNLVPFGHQPYVLARQVAQLDRLSGGRLLLTLVPGTDAPGERAALGTAGTHRGRRLDELLPRLRRWWAGEEVAPDEGGAGLRLPVLPHQAPLEVWLGGAGPDAVSRAGRLADGWLGALLAPEEAGRIRAAIEAEATRAGRRIDPEHFGLSIAYARHDEDVARLAGRLRRRPGGPEPAAVVPVGADALRRLVADLVAQGLSKFVVRPLGPPADLDEELRWLAAAVVDLQT